MKILSILVAVLVFGLLILIHELGHYIAARCFHVRIFEFSIGMGPKLAWYRSKKTGIVYALRMIPIGGFVSMEGELSEEGADGAENTPPLSGAPEEPVVPPDPTLGALASRPAWQRLIVHAAGALVNLIAGFLVITCLTCASGAMELGTTTVGGFVEQAADGTPLGGNTAAVLQVGDEIIRVNGTRVYIADQAYYEILHEGGTDEPITLTVRRGGEVLDVAVVFPITESAGQKFGDCNIRFFAVGKKDFGTVVKQSFFKSCYQVKMIWDSLIDLVTGRYTMDAMSGPIGTATVISDAAATGARNVLSLAALISINLGIVNLLPLPALDGGHLLYTLIELVSRRKLPAKVLTVIDSIGMILLLGLVAVVSFHDLFRLFGNVIRLP